jgi:phosphatidylserine/phosphatidylglycerophosphate/cardiolipin synthase-like enzyme
MSRSVIVLPDATAAAVVSLLQSAKSTLRLKAVEFDAPELIEAVAALARRGVQVRVLLNKPGRGGVSDNAAARDALRAAGAEVANAPHRLSVLHEKSFVIDDERALVMSCDWTTFGVTQARDYLVLTKNRHEVDEIAACFDADWAHQDFKPHGHGRLRLVWGPLNARQRIADFIDATRHTLVVQNARYQDPVMIERLVRAQRRGVALQLMAHAVHRMQAKELATDVGGLRMLDDLGVQVRRLKHLRLHGNMLLADGARAIVGSVNFSPASLDRRRELAIETDDAEVIKQLQATAAHDWSHSRPIDLSEEGLREELEHHGRADDAYHLLGPESEATD